MKNLVRSVYRLFVASRVVLGLEGYVITLALRNNRVVKGSKSLVLAPTTGGSVGDLAMIRSAVHQIQNSVIIVFPGSRKGAFSNESWPERVQAVFLPGLVSGSLPALANSLRRLRKLVSEVSQVVVLGADVMDGHYSPRESFRRARISRALAESGRKTSIVGFSWNSSPHAICRHELVRASESVRLVVRDPVSAERLRLAGAHNVVEAADLAFLTQRGSPPEEIADWIRARRFEGDVVVIINVNSFLEDQFHLVDVMTELMSSVALPPISCILLPHDDRGTHSDVDLASSLANRLRSKRPVLAVPHLLRPEQIVAICNQAEFVLTARMHLAILAAVAGTPSIMIDYQDKAEGLYRLLGIDGVITPSTNLSSDMQVKFAEMFAARKELAAKIQSSLPSILESIHPARWL